MEEIEQNKIFKTAVSFVCYSRQSLFLTGKAGTGKTTFLKYIRQYCQKKLAVTAPTGVAAINAGGVTLHSFFQLPFGTYLPDAPSQWGEGIGFQQAFYNKRQLLSNLRIRETQRAVIKSLELLIIDEISMVRADLLDAIDTVLRFIRRKPLEPFGGVQLLVIGDLFQLPPVIKEEEWERLSEIYRSPYFFDAKVLEETPFIQMELKKIYRQSDEAFIELLNKIRHNTYAQEDLEKLHESYKPSFIPDNQGGIITLTTHNRIADKLNEAALKRLPGKLIEIKAKVNKTFPGTAYPTDEVLRLKEGAQVIFIKNDKGENRRYFNGKIGYVNKFDSNDKKIEIAFPNENEKIKLQTETWNNIRYEYDKTTDSVKEKTIGSFEQYPIRLAWAVTIHKSQGLTFEKAIVDAGQAFAPGQVYVALSRLTKLDGLILYSKIPSHSILTDPRVQEFSDHQLSESEYAGLLDQSQIQYAIQLLLSAYNWDNILDECQQHYMSFISRQIPDREIAVRFTGSLLDDQKELNKVGQKFQHTLSKFFRQAPYNFPLIRERNQAASDWFLNHVENNITALREHIEAQNNKTKVKQYVRDIKRLLETFEQKKIKLEKSRDLTKAFSEAKNIQEAMVWFATSSSLPETATATEPEKNKKPQKGGSRLASLEMYQAGKTIPEIAEERNFAQSTIAGHLISFISTGEVPVSLFVSEEDAEIILKKASTIENNSMTDLKKALKDKYGFNEIRAALAMQSEKEKVK